MVLLNKRHRNLPALPIKEQTIFIKRLSQLLNQGYSIDEALNALKWYSKWRDITEYLMVELEKGRSFDQALADLNFHDSIVSFIHFAMYHGQLIDALNQSVELVQNHLAIIARFKQTIRYPMVLVFSFIILLFFIQTYIYPAFIQLYSSFTATSSIVFSAIRTINFLYYLIIIFISLFVLLVVIWIMAKEKLPMSLRLKVLNKLPIIRYYFKKQMTFLFSIHLSSLLEAGITLKDGLKIMVEQDDHSLLSYNCSLIQKDLTTGLPVSEAFRNHPYFSRELQHIFYHQNTNQRLKRDLLTFANLTIDQLQTSLEKGIKILHPTILAIVALCIIFVYLSILIPMLQLIQTI